VELSDKSVEQNVAKPSRATIAFRQFRAQLEKEGYFERTWIWDAYYVLSITILSIFGTMISYDYPLLASILIGLAMQQAGWIGHDYCHGRGKASLILANLTGGLFNGFSSFWWKTKHNKHHIHTNQLGIDDDIQNDPVLHLWIPEPEKDFPLRPYQHLYYHFVYTFLYFSWRLQSFQSSWERKHKMELALMLINYCWLFYLPLQVSFLSIFIGGFLVAEVVTATHQSEDIIDGLSYNFVEDQFRTTRDVEISNAFVNWIWGGMQYQLEHHLFPTMPKYYYPALKVRVKQFAEENGIEYRASSLFEIFWKTYDTLKRFSVVKK